MFGTDWPISDQKTYVKTVMEKLPLWPRATKNMFSETAKKVFKI